MRPPPQGVERPDGVGRYRRHGRAGRAGAREGPRGGAGPAGRPDSRGRVTGPPLGHRNDLMVTIAPRVQKTLLQEANLRYWGEPPDTGRPGRIYVCDRRLVAVQARDVPLEGVGREV